ncbi:phosphoinositide 3-kinase regulatory subunit 5-like protein [Cricetulus griseus]|nr:phosphoinositide 3-kinase regulatory subunit 5-like protein [Cricetulus griseus]
MWRWSLHKKVERNPGRSSVLVRILLRELEKLGCGGPWSTQPSIMLGSPVFQAESEDVRRVIIPLLLTLMYVLTKQATGITEELYHRAYTFCTRLLTLPAPYSTVALDCAIRLKTEAAVPGTLYQRTVIAEQNLMSELYPYQERVFLFVDPELVSPSVCSALLLEIQAAQEQQTPEACMRHVVSHALQAALGDACHTGKELVLFLRPHSQLRLSADLEALDLQGFRPDWDLARVSTDSGIERDLPFGSDELPEPSSSEMERAALQRKGGIKKRVWPPDFSMPGSWDGPPGLHRRTGRPSGDGELLPGVSRVHTARVLVLGDDRMLGRLAQAYYRLSWDFISFTKGSSPRRKGTAEGTGAELSVCYQKALLSHRPREVTVSLRATGLVLKAIPAGDTEGFSHCTSPNAASATDCTCLRVSVTEVVKSSNLAGRSFTTVANTFRTSSIQVQSQDQRLLTLWLDKDSRRTFRDVVRFEASPCPEPCSRAQKSKMSGLNSHRQEAEKNKAKLSPLLMPINTFSGIVQNRAKSYDPFTNQE